MPIENCQGLRDSRGNNRNHRVWLTELSAHPCYSSKHGPKHSRVYRGANVPKPEFTTLRPPTNSVWSETSVAPAVSWLRTLVMHVKVPCHPSDAPMCREIVVGSLCAPHPHNPNLSVYVCAVDGNTYRLSLWQF